MATGRIMAIDYGTKRTGIAVTDPLQLIPMGLTTVATKDIYQFLEEYFIKEKVVLLLIGLPTHFDGTPTLLENDIRGFIRKISTKYPELNIERLDESYTSDIAREAIRKGGANRKKRQDKSLVDKMSALIMLQEYMQHNLS